MAKRFWGEYKGVTREQLPVFSVTITIQDMRTGKMSAQASTTYIDVGDKPSFSRLEKTSVNEMRTAVRNLKAASDKFEYAPTTEEVAHA